MAVKIRLKRMGKIRQPYFRVVVVDSRKKRDGKVIEEIGKYHPKAEPSFIEVESERAQYWLGVGAQPSEAVEVLFKLTGDWQKFKGLPGAESTVKVAEPKRDKAEIFAEALKDAANEPKADATTKKRAAKKAAAVAEEAKAEETGETAAEKAGTDEVEAAVEEQGPNPADAATTEEAAEESTDGSSDATEAEAKADEKAAEAAAEDVATDDAEESAESKA